MTEQERIIDALTKNRAIMDKIFIDHNEKLIKLEQYLITGLAHKSKLPCPFQYIEGKSRDSDDKSTGTTPSPQPVPVNQTG